MSHVGTRPSLICDAIVAAMSPIMMLDSGGTVTGCVRSVHRVEDDSLEEIENHLDGGVPGILVLFVGGTFTPFDTTGHKWSEEMTFRLLCCLGVTRDMAERFSSNETTPTTAKRPGVEDLQDWAMYYACRAMRAMDGVRLVHPVRRMQGKETKPGLLVSAVDLKATRYVDIYDDPSAVIFESLGIAKNPNDPDKLFKPDNLTPDSDWPGGGVATL